MGIKKRIGIFGGIGREGKKRMGEKLYELRKYNGFSQQELGERLGVARQTVARWESGKATPDAVFLREIARIYGVRVSELLSAEKKKIQTEESENKDKDSLLIQSLLISIFLIITANIMAPLGLVSAIGGLLKLKKSKYSFYVRLLAVICIGVCIWNLYIAYRIYW